MKLPCALLVTPALLLIGGCATNSAKPSAARSPNSPPGTEVGTSFPGVNQPTTTTEAAASNNATANVPNSRR